VGRARKPAGTTVDKRNGAKTDLTGVVSPLGRFDPPPSLLPSTVDQWERYWADPVASASQIVDAGMLRRWIVAVDRYERTIAEADAEPLSVGSTGQPSPNPLYRIAKDAEVTINYCEKQLGIGGLNRAGLGITVASARKSLADMNARYAGDSARPAAVDPRLHAV
jgi:hypothetical protein